jgi:drug/metabolite transporter (DMT)-like permease
MGDPRNPQSVGPRLRAYGLLACGMAIFGSGTPVSKLVTEAFPAFFASGVRMLLAAIALVPLMVLEVRRAGAGRWIPEISRPDWLRIGGIAVAGMFLFSVFMLYGMKEVSGAVGSIVMATTPAVTAAGSVIFLRDRLDRWKSFAIAMAVSGVLAVNLGSTGEGGGNDVLLGSVLVFGAVCGEAAYTLIGKRLTSELSPVTVAALAATLASLLFAVPAAVEIGQVDWGSVEASDLIALAWWGLGTMCIGSVIWYAGLQRVPGTTASAFMGVMPISALLLSYLLLGEAFEPIHAVGMAAVLAGIFAVTRSDEATDG